MDVVVAWNAYKMSKSSADAEGLHNAPQIQNYKRVHISAK